jgi:hypothetical protein
MSDRIKGSKMAGAFGTHGSKDNVYKVLVGKSEGKNHLEDLNVDGRVILKLILTK